MIHSISDYYLSIQKLHLVTFYRPVKGVGKVLSFYICTYKLARLNLYPKYKTAEPIISPGIFKSWVYSVAVNTGFVSGFESHPLSTNRSDKP